MQWQASSRHDVATAASLSTSHTLRCQMYCTCGRKEVEAVGWTSVSLTGVFIPKQFYLDLVPTGTLGDEISPSLVTADYSFCTSPCYANSLRGDAWKGEQKSKKWVSAAAIVVRIMSCMMSATWLKAQRPNVDDADNHSAWSADNHRHNHLHVHVLEIKIWSSDTGVVHQRPRTPKTVIMPPSDHINERIISLQRHVRSQACRIKMKNVIMERPMLQCFINRLVSANRVSKNRRWSVLIPNVTQWNKRFQLW